MNQKSVEKRIAERAFKARFSRIKQQNQNCTDRCQAGVRP